MPARITGWERYQRRLIPDKPGMTERIGESALPVNAPWRLMVADLIE